ncbi:MAG TPA: ABC transporter substrate-binding protein [Candidatus Sulfotelmatobacter sp.]|nr:ABC transporter substrate-binding protein [Candidatus Sulfotelmatobacter sp.]
MSDHEIVIGSCSVLDGRVSQLGRQLVMGATAYFDMVNESGGVNGRKIVLRAYDDDYDPDRVPACFGRLLDDKVFAGAFFVGTPTAARYVPLAEARHFPIVGLFTGAECLYTPLKRYVLNARASYRDETRMQIDILWARGLRRIAIIYPDDAFGLAVLDGVKAALKKHGSAPAATAHYVRKSALVAEAVEAVRRVDPQAVVLVGPYGPVAAMLRKAAKESWAPQFLSVSFVGTDELIREAGAAAEGMIITQVLPPPSAVDVPTVALYRKQMALRFPDAELGYVGLEGFVDAMVLVEGLKRAGKNLTREKLITALESMHDVDLGLGPDLKLSFSPSDHKGFHTVFATLVHGGVAVPLKGRQLLARK